jgi:multisubunit Na+/H+ antiporter MnhE subunit
VLHRLLQPVRIVWALLYFLYELVLANARLAWDVATPGLPAHRAIIRSTPTRGRQPRCGSWPAPSP